VLDSPGHNIAMPKAAEGSPSGAACVKPVKPVPVVPAAATLGGDDDDSINSEDLELSDEEEGVPPGPGGPGSDVDEDWGSWE
jgi:hypothetical protein